MLAFMRPADQLRKVATQVRCPCSMANERRQPSPVPASLRLGLTPTPELPIWIAATRRPDHTGGR